MKRGRNQRRRQGSNPNRALDSNGPEVRIRGTANQIYDKYITLARDATTAGDRIKGESYLQYAEHYFRLIRSQQPTQPLHQPNQPQQAPGEGVAEQPALEGGEENKDHRRHDAGRRNGAAEDKQSDGAANDPEDAGDASVENIRASEATKKPRRRRPRRAAQEDDGGDGEKDDGAEDAQAAE